jgi:hypothetical protein
VDRLEKPFKRVRDSQKQRSGRSEKNLVFQLRAVRRHQGDPALPLEVPLHPLALDQVQAWQP